MQINALAPARLAQAFIAHAASPAVRSVIHVTDMKIENTNPDFFSYTMAKHALASTIGMLAKGHANSNVRIYGLAPGAVLASHDQRAAALFLASGALASGQSLFIDSGQHLLDQPRDVIWLAREQAQARGATA